MANDLASPADLAGFPGAPFSDTVVDAAVADIRGEAGWHIAPVRTETVGLDTDGGTVLYLPTLLLLAVTEVRDTTGDTPAVVSGWRKSRAGMLSTRGCWPSGFEAIAVDMTHGHAETPPDLYAVIAERCQLATTNAAVRQESAGGESIAYSASGAVTAESRAILARYTIPPRF